jgi:hypothetical protein
MLCARLSQASPSIGLTHPSGSRMSYLQSLSADGLQQSSARQALERLVAARVVTRIDVGRSAAYELDRELAFSNIVLAHLFQSENRLRDDLIEALAHACGELGSELMSVILFGSLVRGERDFRDADLLFIVPNKKETAQLHGPHEHQ